MASMPLGENGDNDAAACAAADAPPSIDVARLCRFLEAHAGKMPAPYLASHSQRITMVFFLLAAADAVDVPHAPLRSVSPGLSDLLTPGHELNKQLVEWIYTLRRPHSGGFAASDSFQDADVAATYSALSCLLILGDDLSRINKKQLMSFLASLCGSDGGFHQYSSQSPLTNSDARFVYCALAIARYMKFNLADDIFKRVPDFLLSTLNEMQQSFGSQVGAEAHGGYVYCCVASLGLLEYFASRGQALRESLIRWCILQQRENGGFCGRVGKKTDTCYSFWIGASLKILGTVDLVNKPLGRSFLASQQCELGGIPRDCEAFSDVLHTYLSLSALSVFESPQIQDIDPLVNISKRKLRHLEKLN